MVSDLCRSAGALDFPAVDLSVDGSVVTVRFQNPLRQYAKLAKLAGVAGFLDFSVTVAGDGVSTGNDGVISVY